MSNDALQWAEPVTNTEHPSIVEFDELPGGRKADGPRLSSGNDSPAPEQVLPLYTPAEAARLLAVRESWLRRRATARAVPCTFLGKHLRFSHADVVAIVVAGASKPGPATRTGRIARRGRR